MSDEVDGILRVLSCQVGGDSPQISADVVSGKRCGEMSANVLGKATVSSTKEDAREESLASITVERDDGVHVREERLQRWRLIGVDVVGRDVPFEIGGLVDSVVGRVRLLGDEPADDVGEFFEAPAVVRHDPKRAAKLAHLVDLWMLEQFSERHRSEVCVERRRVVMSAAVMTATRMTKSGRDPTSWMAVARRDCMLSTRDPMGPSDERSVIATYQYQAR